MFMATTNSTETIVSQFRLKFNQFWDEYFKGKTPKNGDYLNSMTAADLIRLKRVFSGINGMVTMLTEMEFVNRLHQAGVIDCEPYQALVKHILGSSPYTNGYDVRCDEAKIVAEVKCNFPVGKNKYGAAQIEAIMDDLCGLHCPEKYKKKENALAPETRKFMVLLREKDDDNSNEAIKHLIGQAKKEIPEIRIEIFEGTLEKWDFDTIYLVIIPLEQLDMSYLKI